MRSPLATARLDAELGRGARSARARAAGAPGGQERGKQDAEPGARSLFPSRPPGPRPAPPPPRRPHAGRRAGFCVFHGSGGASAGAGRERAASSPPPAGRSGWVAAGPASCSPDAAPEPAAGTCFQNRCMCKPASELTAELAQLQDGAPQSRARAPAGPPRRCASAGPLLPPRAPVTQEPAQVSCASAPRGTHLCRGRSTDTGA